MARPDYDVRVTPSVFDRLIDDDPKNSRDVVLSRRESVDNYRKAVQRDLDNLLNTRNPMADLAPEFEQVRQSVLAYGLPDFSAFNIGSPSDQMRLRQRIEETLRWFEPRLTEIVVSLSPAAPNERALRLRVDARLMMDPAPEPVSFDIIMPLISRNYEVREAT